MQHCCRCAEEDVSRNPPAAPTATPTPPSVVYSPGSLASYGVVSAGGVQQPLLVVLCPPGTEHPAAGSPIAGLPVLSGVTAGPLSGPMMWDGSQWLAIPSDSRAMHGFIGPDVGAAPSSSTTTATTAAATNTGPAMPSLFAPIVVGGGGGGGDATAATVAPQPRRSGRVDGVRSIV